MKNDNSYKFYKDLCFKHGVRLNIFNLILLKFKSKFNKSIKRKIHLLKIIERNCKQRNNLYFVKFHLLYMKERDFSFIK